MAALALALLAAAALLPEEASAYGTGYVGAHSHGQLYCGNYGRINLYGDGGFYRLQASAHGSNAREYDLVTHRAHLYRWNGQYWVFVVSTGWYDKYVSWYGNTLGFPGPLDPPVRCRPRHL